MVSSIPPFIVDISNSECRECSQKVRSMNASQLEACAERSTGLAQASVTSLSNAVIFPEEFFSDPDLEHANVQEQLASLSIPARENAPKIRSHIASIKPVHSHGLHSLTIVANMLADKRLAPSTIHQFDTDEPLATTLKDVGEVIREYSRLWLVPADGNSTVLRSKIEELQWLATIIFGLGGWREGHKFRSDFFLYVSIIVVLVWI